MSEKKLQGKVAIVTGSGRGIGKAISLKFAEEGANLVVNAHRDVDAILETAREIHSLGCKALPIKADVSNVRDVKKMIDATIEKFGRIDILVNNAGIFRPSPIEKVSVKNWDEVMNVNLKGAFLCSKYAGQHMISQKSGVIVNIASISGLIPEIHSGAYGPSKAALISLTQILAVEWARHNIRVNAVCPGPIETAITDTEWPDEHAREGRIKAIPLQRFGKPEEIAGTVLFLATDDSSYMTGHALVADGGSSKSLYYLIHQLLH